MMNGNTGFVIMVNDRYFYAFGKKGSMLTAWSLAGGKIYGTRNDGTIQEIVDKLRAKKYCPKVMEVQLGEEVAPF